MCRLYHVSQVRKEPHAWTKHGLNRKRSLTLEGEILIGINPQFKEQKSRLKRKSSSLKWQEMQMSEGTREQMLSGVHFLNIGVLNQERFRFPRCHNRPFFVNYDVWKRVFLFVEWENTQVLSGRTQCSFGGALYRMHVMHGRILKGSVGGADPKKSWRRTTQQEYEDLGMSWEEVKRTAKIGSDGRLWWKPYALVGAKRIKLWKDSWWLSSNYRWFFA